MLDLWEQTSRLFIGYEGAHGELMIGRLSEQAMRQLLNYVLVHSREPESGFQDFFEKEQVAKSSKQVIDGLASGDIIGGLITDVLVDGCVVPRIALISDEPGYVVIDFACGSHWNPVNATAFFELLRLIRYFDTTVTIRLSKRQFGSDGQSLFDRTFREYCDERVQM